MKRPGLRWCALIISILMIGGGMAYQISGSISAHEAQQTIMIEEQARDAAAQAALQKTEGTNGEEVSAEDLVKAPQQNEHTDDNSVMITEIL